MTTKIRWVVPSLSRDVLRDLNRRDNTVAVSHLIVRLLLQTLLFIGAYYTLTHGVWWLAIAFVALNGGLWFFMGWAGIGHELFHGTVTTNRQFDRALFRVFSVLTWSNYGFFEYSHWRHHKLTLFPDDPELPPRDSITFGQAAWYIAIDIPSFYKKAKVLLVNSLGRVPLPARITDLPTPTEYRGIVNGARVVLSAQIAMAVVFVLIHLSLIHI